jgi:hypothetical protein
LTEGGGDVKRGVMANQITKQVRSKKNLWYKFFTDPNNQTTFCNATQSAKAAGYNCSTYASFRNVGHRNFTEFHDELVKWQDETELSEYNLRKDIIRLKSAKETKFFPHTDENGKFQIAERQVEALQVQVKALQLALRLKGMDQAREAKTSDGVEFHFNFAPPAQPSLDHPKSAEPIDVTPRIEAPKPKPKGNPTPKLRKKPAKKAKAKRNASPEAKG